MSGYDERAPKIAAQTMTDNDLHRNSVSLMTNEITGTITTKSDSYLVVNIPYDKGWSIYVDGEKRVPDKANVMFMGTPLFEGTHDIKLKYHTPGLLPGILLSLAGIMILIILTITEKKKNAI